MAKNLHKKERMKWTNDVIQSVSTQKGPQQQKYMKDAV